MNTTQLQNIEPRFWKNKDKKNSSSKSNEPYSESKLSQKFIFGYAWQMMNLNYPVAYFAGLVALNLLFMFEFIIFFVLILSFVN